MIRIIEYTAFNGKSKSFPIDIVLSEDHVEELRKRLKKKHGVDSVLFSTTTELTKAIKYDWIKPRVKEKQKKSDKIKKVPIISVSL